MIVLLRVAVCVVFTSLLASCGGGHTTRVIDTPGTRELAGWQKPYEVDGQRYQPLRDHRGFRQRGVASWYGRKFHGRKTSNGEIYDMYGLSAAHKTLPLGVYVKVTHLGNGRHIIVRVNDRGPFVAGRIIDLSYGAAKKLGIVESGTAQVELVALGYRVDEKNLIAAAPANYDTGTFAVQVGAFSNSTNAYRLADNLRRRYGKAVVSTMIVSGHPVYKVRVGTFHSLQKAEQEVQRLVEEGLNGSFVVAFN